MLNERIKMAESIDTVHTHTHTHTPYSYKQNWWTVWRERELHFSEIKYSFIKHRLKEDSSKSLL